MPYDSLVSGFLKSDIVVKWFEVSSLEHLWVHGRGFRLRDGRLLKDNISAFVIRSSCRICRLTLQDCDCNLAYTIMDALASVEHLCIRNPYPRNATLIIRCIAYSDGTCLPNLKELQVVCLPGHAGDELVVAMSCLFTARGKESKSMLASGRVVIDGARSHMSCFLG